MNLEYDIHRGGLMSWKLLLGVVMLLAISMTAAIHLPTWAALLLGSLTLALLYIFARLGSRYDPLDPRVGSCIPPIQSYRTDDRKPPD